MELLVAYFYSISRSITMSEPHLHHRNNNSYKKVHKSIIKANKNCIEKLRADNIHIHFLHKDFTGNMRNTILGKRKISSPCYYNYVYT